MTTTRDLVPAGRELVEQEPVTEDPIVPMYEQELVGGGQRVYRFANDQGASVVRNRGSYGNQGGEGLWEMAVIHFPGPSDHFDLVRGTPVIPGDTVEGWLTEADVHERLVKIRALPSMRPELPSSQEKVRLKHGSDPKILESSRPELQKATSERPI